MKNITNTRNNGYHFYSGSYWQDWNKKVVLSDVIIYHISHEALIKFEQGGKILYFIYFKNRIRYNIMGSRL